MKKLKIAPHTFFFLLLTILYGVPMFVTLFGEVNDHIPYVSNIILGDFHKTRWSVLIIYIVATSSFLLGTGLMSSIINRCIKRNSIPLVGNSIESDNKKMLPFQKIIIYGFVALGCFLVLQMVRAGTFSTDYMDTFDSDFEGYAAQNVFTLLCDMFFFFFIYLWMNYKRQYKWLKWLLIMLIFVTLARGSRMYSIPLMFIVLYKMIYIDGLTKKRLLYIALGGLIATIGLFSVFFFRHDTTIEGADIGSLLFLLVQYEVCGIHIPLMNLINMGWHLSFAPMYPIVTDTILFLVPRAVFPAKNDFLYFDNIQNTYVLSPYGGIVGEASVIVYFGILFPLFFFSLGVFLSYLYNLTKTRDSYRIKPIYIFACCSLMFTFLRNGILISIKNFVIMAIVLAVITLARRVKIGTWK